MKRYTLAVLFAFAVAWGQGPTAEVTGSVSDASGGVIPNAKVVITNTHTNAQRSLVSNSSGIYDASSSPPGVYSIKVSASGFRTEVRNDIELQVDQVARIDFTMQIGNVSDTVEVRATAPTLD